MDQTKKLNEWKAELVRQMNVPKTPKAYSWKVLGQSFFSGLYLSLSVLLFMFGLSPVGYVIYKIIQKISN